MKVINYFFSENIIEAIGWTLIHSLWQGLAVAIVIAVAAVVFRNRSTQIKYLLYCSGMAFFAVAAFATFFYHISINTHEPLNTDEVSGTISEEIFYLANSQTATDTTPLSGFINDHLNFIVSLWLVGLLIFFIRMTGSLIYLQRLKSVHTLPAFEYWTEKSKSIAKKLGIQKKIKLLESTVIDIPMVAGYFKPVILLPVGLLTGLDNKQIEAIIAHELAHIKRHDYLINIFQTVIETIFFYHPAVWWLSSMIRDERENCCDDMAIAATGSSVELAKALAVLEERKIKTTSMALTFSGKKHQLLNRIKRLTGYKVNNSRIYMVRIMAGVFILAIMISAGVSAHTKWNNDLYDNEKKSETLAKNNLKIWRIGSGTFKEMSPTVPAVMPVNVDSPKTETVIKIKSKDDGKKKKYKVKLDGEGNIVELKENGKTIPKDQYYHYRHHLGEYFAENNSDVDFDFDFHFEMPEIPDAPHFKNMPHVPPMPPMPDMKHFKDIKIVLPPMPPMPPMAAPPAPGDTSAAAMKKYEERMKQYEKQMEEYGERMEKWGEKFEAENKVWIKKFEKDIEGHNWDEFGKQMEEYGQQMEEFSKQWKEQAHQLKEIEKEAIIIDKEGIRNMKEKGALNMKELEDQLLQDNLIKDRENYSLKISQKEMMVNGEKKPASVHQKYVKLLEEKFGTEVSKNFSFVINKNNND